jgi:hypothetical protein
MCKVFSLLLASFNDTMKLYTNDEEFDLLHQAVDKTRKNAKEVKVPRQALINLLMDHSHLVKLVKELGGDIEFS